MGTLLLVVAGLVFVLLFVAEAASVLIHWRVDRTSPRGIVRRLTSPGTRHSVRFGANRFAWNPALPLDRKNRVYGPAVATYWLDQQNNIQMDFVPSYGQAVHFSGPFPTALPAPADAPSLAALIAKPALGLLAFLVIFAHTNGSLDHRLGIGFAVGVGGWFVAWLATAISSMVMRTRALAAQTTH
jgi:hypothetical protein